MRATCVFQNKSPSGARNGGDGEMDQDSSENSHTSEFWDGGAGGAVGSMPG